MSLPSNWPLSESAVRLKADEQIEDELSILTLSKACYMTAVGFYPRAKAHAMLRQDHDDFILIYCADGKGYLSFAGEQYRVGSGELFILPPRVSHHYRADSEDPWTVYWFHFKGEDAQAWYEYVYQGNVSPVIKNMANIDFVPRLNELLNAVSQQTDRAAFILASNLVRTVFSEIVLKSKQTTTSLDVLDLDGILHYMKTNLHRRVELEELAGLSHFSKYHFIREYVRLVGLSPIKHFIQLKMEHACFLLEQTNLSMSEIAGQIGYDDPLYFSRVFRQLVGLAPSLYRKQL